MSLPVFCTHAVGPDQGHATGSLCPGVTRRTYGQVQKDPLIGHANTLDERRQ